MACRSFGSLGWVLDSLAMLDGLEVGFQATLHPKA